LAREPAAAQVFDPDTTASASVPETTPDAWAEVCEQVAWRLLVLTEQMRPALDELEGSEQDPDRLAQLYQVDHGITRMRRVARDLRILADRGGEDIAGYTTSLLDIIRMAASAIEHYGRVLIGPVAELAVVAYAADDMASLLAALADNATRYSPSTVTVSAHLLADGSVMIRVEDAGLGIKLGWLAALNNRLAGPMPQAEVAGRHTGFAVVHRLARRHGLWVQLARRNPPAQGGGGRVTGTVAMLGIPPALLCEIPDQPLAAMERAWRLASPAEPQLARIPARTRPDPIVPPRGSPCQGAASQLPRRQPGSVRTPAHREPVATEQLVAPSPAAGGLAFAAELQAFSAAEAIGSPPGDEPGKDRSGDAEGHMP
jgi:hypothetical protein